MEMIPNDQNDPFEYTGDGDTPPNPVQPKYMWLGQVEGHGNTHGIKGDADNGWRHGFAKSVKSPSGGDFYTHKELR